VLRQSHPFQEEMMRKISGWAGLRSAVVALGLVAWTSTGARASAIQSNATASGILSYSTAGQIDPKQGVNGTPVISFTQVSNSAVDLSSGKLNASLGTFVLTALPDGQSTTYDNTPFSITMVPQSLGNTTINSSPIVLTGTLSGKVEGGYTSTVTATFNKPPSSPYLLGNQSVQLSVPVSSTLLVPSSTNSGQTTVQLQVLSSPNPEAPVPEPSTIALFVTTLGGLGLRRYVQSRRQPRS
jgi:hypothetical protein